ncbi:hypothetical protein ACX93W_24535 [Paenibacillus sp. CAU 1782]
MRAVIAGHSLMESHQRSFSLELAFRIALALGVPLEDVFYFEEE